MANYFVNNRAQPNGDYEVHKEGCSYMPSDKTSLGDHSTCSTAVAAARRHYSTANGCYWCSKACHTT